MHFPILKKCIFLVLTPLATTPYFLGLFFNKTSWNCLYLLSETPPTYTPHTHTLSLSLRPTALNFCLFSKATLTMVTINYKVVQSNGESLVIISLDFSAVLPIGWSHVPSQNSFFTWFLWHHCPHLGDSYLHCPGITRRHLGSHLALWLLCMQKFSHMFARQMRRGKRSPVKPTEVWNSGSSHAVLGKPISWLTTERSASSGVLHHTLGL